MTLLRWRFGRSAPDVLSRPSGPAAGRQVMNSASFKPGSTAGVHDAVLQYARQGHRQPARAGSRTGRRAATLLP